MEYQNGILTINGVCVELNSTEIAGLDIYATLIFMAASKRGATIVKTK